MKIKNVEEGYAGLLLRVDGNGQSLVFDNMRNQNVTGTRDWQKYSISLSYPKNGETIIAAGILTGKGEAWFDNFTVTIDGRDIQGLAEIERNLPRALTDKEFDSGSQIDLPELTKEDVNRLELLGRVWGFLKYHHPAIASGNYNWDYELFRFLPGYLATESNEESNQLLVQWIKSLGEVPRCNPCAKVDKNAFAAMDKQWITEQHKELRDQLLHIYKNRVTGGHHYISMAPNVGNPVFENENPYRAMSYPDDGFRLLSLYRYWNMIHYFFPYKHLMDEDWDGKLEEYIPRFAAAANELAYEQAVLQIIGDIQDTHANLWGGGDKIDAWKGENYPPFHLRFIENQLVVTEYYNTEKQDNTGIQPGDVITKINGVPVAQLIQEKQKFYPASNPSTRMRNMAPELLRSNADSTVIEVSTMRGVSENKTIDLFPADSLNLFNWYPESGQKSYKLLADNIGYITLQTIQQDDIPKIKNEFKDTRGIIIDIRNYPATFVPFTLGSFFTSTPTPFVKFTQGSIDNPGQFTFTDDLYIPSEGSSYPGKLVVLVNELTQSQAEYTTMAFRAGDNTTIIGSTTAGADGNVSSIVLPGGLRTLISGIGVYYPDGRETQRVGIVPDITVHPSIEGIRNGRDELLDKAIELILNN